MLRSFGVQGSLGDVHRGVQLARVVFTMVLGSVEKVRKRQMAERESQLGRCRCCTLRILFAPRTD